MLPKRAMGLQCFVEFLCFYFPSIMAPIKTIQDLIVPSSGILKSSAADHNHENATADGSRVSALTFETYEDYISVTSQV